MKVLTLSIKQKYFDEILAGTKKVETREIRPTNAKKYIKYVCNGEEYNEEDLPEEGDVSLKAVEYDAIKLLTGAYSGKRPYIVVECKGADIFLMSDEEGNDITYEYKGKEYIAAQIDFHLGKIIEKSELVK